MSENTLTYKSAHARRKGLVEAEKQLKALIGVDSRIEKEAAQAAEEYLEELRALALWETPIERLNEYASGIRVSALKKVGYKSVYQLKDASVSSLTRINGVGSKSADGIVRSVRQIVKDVNASTRLRIDLNNKSAKQEALIRALYLSRELKQNSDAASAVYKSNHGDISQALKDTRPASNRISWLFSSAETKRRVGEYLQKVDFYTVGEYGNEISELISGRNRILKARHDEYWSSFARNAAGFYSTLDAILSGRKQGEASATRRKYRDIIERNGLPNELAVAIESVPLNLTGLKCTLRAYQYFGVQYIISQGAVLLGDDMGLGKTVQAIAAMTAIENSAAGKARFLVVCPASVFVNWCREINKHSSLDVVGLHGKDLFENLEKWQNEGGVGVTTYETANKIDLEEGLHYSMLVVDEAHYIKNPSANRTVSVLRLRAHTDRVLFMTGTSLENNVGEMCFLIKSLKPEVEREASKYATLEHALLFRQAISSVYFRRTKEDVLDELPEKVEKEMWCELNDSESEAYCASVMSKNFMDMRRVSWSAADIGDSSKADLLRDLCEQAVSEGRKVIVFSFFISTIAAAKEVVDAPVFGPIDGSVSAENRQKIIDDFTNCETGAVLLAQIQAGGTGLNIQAASVIVFCEPQLKPSLESQAVGRAFRMGQINKVMVYRLLCANTVDEQIVNILKEKQRMFDSFAAESVSGQESLKLTDSDYNAMVDAEYEKISKAKAQQ